jgi:hypothetical protein
MTTFLAYVASLRTDATQNTLPRWDRYSARRQAAVLALILANARLD